MNWSEAGPFYEWARESLLSRGVTGPVLDLGCGTGRGTLLLRQAGLDASGIDQDDSLDFVYPVVTRRWVPSFPSRRSWEAIVAIRVFGYGGLYGDERGLLEGMMRESKIVLFNAQNGGPSDYEWMTPAPSFSRGHEHLLVDWERT